MLSFITVPTDLVATISTTSGDVFTSMIPVAVVVIGIALGLGLLSWSVKLFRGRKGRR